MNSKRNYGNMLEKTLDCIEDSLLTKDNDYAGFDSRTNTPNLTGYQNQNLNFNKFKNGALFNIEEEEKVP